MRSVTATGTYIAIMIKYFVALFSLSRAQKVNFDANEKKQVPKEI